MSALDLSKFKEFRFQRKKRIGMSVTISKLGFYLGADIIDKFRPLEAGNHKIEILTGPDNQIALLFGKGSSNVYVSHSGGAHLQAKDLMQQLSINGKQTVPATIEKSGDDTYIVFKCKPISEGM